MPILKRRHDGPTCETVWEAVAAAMLNWELEFGGYATSRRDVH